MKRYTLEVVTNSGNNETLMLSDDEDFIEQVSDMLIESDLYQSVKVIEWREEKTDKEKEQFITELKAKIEELT